MSYMWNNAGTNFLAVGLHKEDTLAIICKNVRGIFIQQYYSRGMHLRQNEFKNNLGQIV